MGGRQRIIAYRVKCDCNPLDAPTRAAQVSSPTQRSKAHLEKQGYRVAIVEHWNAFARIRQDLFGVVDLLCLRGSETLAVQTTSASNMSARVKKIAESDAIADIRAAGWGVVVHGWKRGTNGRYTLREVDVS